MATTWREPALTGLGGRGGGEGNLTVSFNHLDLVKPESSLIPALFSYIVDTFSFLNKPV